MTDHLQMRLGDTSPSIAATLETVDLVPINLTGATVRFTMRSAQAPYGVVVNNQVAAIVDAPGGKVRYDWQAGDTATVGTYSCGFIIRFADNTVRSVPSEGTAVSVTINPAI